MYIYCNTKVWNSQPGWIRLKALSMTIDPWTALLSLHRPALCDRPAWEVSTGDGEFVETRGDRKPMEHIPGSRVADLWYDEQKLVPFFRSLHRQQRMMTKSKFETQGWQTHLQWHPAENLRFTWGTDLEATRMWGRWPAGPGGPS